MAQLVLTSDTLAGTPATGTLEYNGQFYGTDSAAARAQMQRITLGTAVASTSGTSIDFTSIPAWVKKITVMMAGVSSNGTATYAIQIGSGSVDTTSTYVGTSSRYSSTVSSSALTTSFNAGDSLAATTCTTLAILSSVSSTVWVYSCNFGRDDTLAGTCAGAKTLSGALDRVRITTVAGTATFDAGSVNILYEG